MKQPRIDHVGPRQVDDLIALAERCSDGPRWPRAAWADFTAPAALEAHKSILLALRGEMGDLLGFVAGTLLGDTAELEFLLIDPAHRGKGLGRLMLADWIERAVASGATQMLLEVRASHHGAIRLYQGMGFAAEGRRRSYYRDPEEDAVMMRAVLWAP